jgi:hypothetical protein
MSAFKQPYFDRKQTYDAESRFSNHVMQKYMALFLSKPHLYHSIHELGEGDRQSYFFYTFLKFVQPYVNLTLEKDYDAICYFGSLHIEKSGATNVCGGGGQMTHSARKQFADRHRRSVDETKQRVAYMAEKYKLHSDERTFIGHKQIWKHPSPELLKLQGWEWVANQCYADDTFQCEMPEKMDIDLVPLAIRNKTYQRWKNRRNQRISMMASVNRKEEEEEEDIPPAPVLVENTPKMMVVITPEMEALMDEDW